MSITPYLLYEDVAGALKFLAKAFGFRKYGTQKRLVFGSTVPKCQGLTARSIMPRCNSVTTSL